MILRNLFAPLRPAGSTTTTTTTLTRPFIRSLHHSIPLRPVPTPTPFVPDTQTFLTLIGRKMSAHAAKIPSWEALFTLSSAQLRELGVEPARSRRYLLRWREKFRNGEFGVGGDLKLVKDGVAELRVVEVPVEAKGPEDAWKYAATASRTPGTVKRVVNVPEGKEKPLEKLQDAKPVRYMTVKGAQLLVGPHVEMIPGTGGMGARLRVKEGLWEVKRGRKVDGGERRRAEVRSKRRAQENKERREKENLR